MAWRGFRGRGALLVLPLVCVLGVVWWWAVLRIVLLPEQAGAVEGVVAAGGWGLSLLPVHVVPAAAAGVEPERSRGHGRIPGPGGVAGAWPLAVARALRRRRPGGGPGPPP
ncbi:hypothetical protein [Streptomyces enissocaesilis]|uniref:Uncharacterized protein n=1 Tax=Streptomyces enissocaesilis TaxID=332589 RepID=A0ABP6J953_9ACTN